MPTFNIVFLPGFILLALMFSLGAGLWFSALNVAYRDVKYITPFLVQIWMYVSPIVYPASLVPERFRLLYSLNPLVAVVLGWLILNESITLKTVVGAGCILLSILLINKLRFKVSPGK